MRRTDGFTLLELMVVVVLVGIMAGLGISSIGGLVQSRRFDSGLQQLATAARRARQYAQTRSETYTFEFTVHDPARNGSPTDPPDRFSVYRGRTRPAGMVWEPLPDRIWIARTSVAGPPYRWSFDERGTVTPEAIGTIVLQDGSNPDPGLANATSLVDYLRGRGTNPNGRSRGLILSTYLGKISVVTTGGRP